MYNISLYLCTETTLQFTLACKFFHAHISIYMRTVGDERERERAVLRYTYVHMYMYLPRAFKFHSFKKNIFVYDIQLSWRSIFIVVRRKRERERACTKKRTSSSWRFSVLVKLIGHYTPTRDVLLLTDTITSLLRRIRKLHWFSTAEVNPFLLTIYSVSLKTLRGNE